MKATFPLSKIIITSLLFVFSIFVSDQKVSAQTAISWYVNPAGNSCVPVDSTYVLTPDDITAGYVTIEEYCGGSGEGSDPPCTYSKCTAPGNDTYNPNGAVASFAASIDKNVYAPGEQGLVTTLGSLYAYPGSDLYDVLTFFTFDIPLFSGLICFISGFLSGGCPAVRAVSASAQIPAQDNSLIISGAECIDPFSIVEDPDGFGFWYNRSFPSQEIPGLTCYWNGYKSTFSANSEPRRGRFTSKNFFTAPRIPGNYSVVLTGCHEKFYCVTGVTLDFTVGPVTPPTIQIRFSDMLQKAKDLFAFI